MERFDIYMADIKFEDTDNSKTRPSIILQESPENIIVLKVTSQKHTKVPQYELQDWVQEGLWKKSYVDLNKVYKITNDNIKQILGRLTKIDKNGLIQAINNNHQRLVSSLNENMLPNEEYIKTHEEEISNTIQTNYFYEIVNNLIKDEIEAITGYDNAINSFVNLGIMNYVDVLKDIAEEEKVHIGQLQTILEYLKPGTEKKFDDGQEEAKEQIAKEEKATVEEDFDNNESDLSKATPYMLRNDGELIECKPMHPYIKFVYENIEDCLRKLSESRFFALEWFYNNTLKEDTKNNIRIIVNYLISNNMINKDKGEYFRITDETYIPNDTEIEGFIETTNADTNQEFLRTRTSSLLFGGNSNDIYFRISSIRYNWFENIWNLANKYSKGISTITIGKDSNTFGGKFEPYKVNGVTIEHLPIKQFITLSGNPIIEEFTNNKIKAISEANIELKKGKSISEAYNYLHPNYISGFYHKQVEDDLEEDIEKILQKEGK